MSDENKNLELDFKPLIDLYKLAIWGTTSVEEVYTAEEKLKESVNLVTGAFRDGFSEGCRFVRTQVKDNETSNT